MLEPIGLGQDEERVYEALVDRTRATIDELAGAAGATTDRVTVLANSLVDRGLARRAAGPEHVYLLAPPEPAIEALVADRLNELQRVRALASDLAERARHASQLVDPAGLVEVVSGEGAVRQLFMQMLGSTRRELWAFDRPPYAVDARESDPIQADRIARHGITFRTVFDRSLLEDPVQVERILRGVEAGEDARVGDVPLKFAMADREYAILPLLHEGDGTPEAVVIVRRSVLLDSLTALFEAVWHSSAPVRRRARVVPGTGRDGPDEETRELIRLLATGMTDEAVARQLGVSERTIRRRIRSMLDGLGVHTRFQAAIRAVERGWL